MHVRSSVGYNDLESLNSWGLTPAALPREKSAKHSGDILMWRGDSVISPLHRLQINTNIADSDLPSKRIQEFILLFEIQGNDENVCAVIYCPLYC